MRSYLASFLPLQEDFLSRQATSHVLQLTGLCFQGAGIEPFAPVLANMREITV
jgi:hypothetical protein